MEIFRNTLLKLTFRQGTNNDRKRIIFNSGEPAYTNDTQRLYVGNGVLSGGKITSNFCLDTTTDVTGYTNAETGDTAFNNDNNKLYRLKYTSSSNLSSWEVIGGVYSTTDSQLGLNSQNQFYINPLSANLISSDAVTDMITLQSGRLALSANIPYNRVSTNTIILSSGIEGFNKDGRLSTGFNPLSGNATIKLKRVMTRCENDVFIFSENTTSTTKLSTGHYRIEFSPISETYVPYTQVYDTLSIYPQPRVLTPTISSCDVVLLSSDNSLVDGDFIFKLDY